MTRKYVSRTNASFIKSGTYAFESGASLDGFLHILETESSTFDNPNFRIHREIGEKNRLLILLFFKRLLLGMLKDAAHISS